MATLRQRWCVKARSSLYLLSHNSIEVTETLYKGLYCTRLVTAAHLEQDAWNRDHRDLKETGLEVRMVGES